jgi:hypothetical protein
MPKFCTHYFWRCAQSESITGNRLVTTKGGISTTKPEAPGSKYNLGERVRSCALLPARRRVDLAFVPAAWIHKI